MGEVRSQSEATECRASEVGAYLDGELDAQASEAFEAHFKTCAACHARVLEQKRLLCLFETAFGAPLEKRLELPADFARVVTARAQTDMTELLRRPTEHRRAFILTISLVALSCALLGATLFDGIFAPAASVLRAVARLLSMAAHTLLDTVAGALVIVRSLGSRLVAETHHLRLLMWLVLSVALVWLWRLISRQTETEKE